MSGLEPLFGVEVYKTSLGSRPFSDWLAALRDRRAASIIRSRLARLRAGNPGHWRPVGSGIYELKIDVGPGYRVYFRSVGKYSLLVLCGGSKATQSYDIAKAKAYWGDYVSRFDTA